MRLLSVRLGFVLMTSSVLWAVTADAQTAEEGWIDLTGSQSFDAWKPPTGAWAIVGGVHLDPDNPRRLVAEPGTGVLSNGPTGRAPNLVTNESFGDLEAHVEFLIPQGSNSGVKFQGLYEVQILDSWGKEKVTGTDCGGIYPRANAKPKYHYLDEGHPPKANASRPAGQWQTLDVHFQAPRFDTSGQKVAQARFVKVVLNGRLIHEDVEVATPTGAAWVKKESPTGPLLLQGDHGPVAFRNVRIRPLTRKSR
jgi:hypothetical protein